MRTVWKVALQKSSWWFWWTTTWVSKVPLLPKRPTVSWAAWKRSSFPLLRAQEIIWSIMSRFTHKTMNWSKRSEGLKLLLCEKSGFIQAGGKKAQKGSCCCLKNKYLIRACREDRSKYFSEDEANSKRAMGNSHELQHRKLQLDIRKIFWPWRWSAIKAGCPEMLWNLCVWRYSHLDRTRSWTCC